MQYSGNQEEIVFYISCRKKCGVRKRMCVEKMLGYSLAYTKAYYLKHYMNWLCDSCSKIYS